MSEVEKALTDAYYWLSMYKSGATTEGLAMEKVKEAIFKQPTLNENQQIVLKEIKDISQECDYNLLGIIWVLGQRAKHDTDISRFTNNEILQVLQEFSQWAQEQEENK